MAQQAKMSVRKLASIPIIVTHRAVNVGFYTWRMSSGSADAAVAEVPSAVRFDMEWRPVRLPQSKPLDGWYLRDTFMSLDLKQPQSLLSFLNETGNFWDGHSTWTLQDFCGVQQLFAGLLLKSPSKWREYGNTAKEFLPGLDVQVLFNKAARCPLQFRWEATPQRDWHDAKQMAVVDTVDTMSAIMVTIQIDHLRRAKFRACARPDCPQFFEITSQHKRKYCKQYCAHLESLRQMRKRQKQKAQKSASANRKHSGKK